MILFSQLEAITGGRMLRFTKDVQISSLHTDSRKAIGTSDSVFFAIKGEHHDGHQYIHELYEKGARYFVVEREPAHADSYHDANILLTDSSIKALQAIVAYHRSALHMPVIGITGSNGKTIVKEWLFQLLSPDYKIAKNPGSYNSQLGVPLSIWQLQKHHELGIFEAGISTTGEMERLARIIQPTIGIFTNIGSAHDEGFSSLQEKVKEKLALFTTCKTVIYCKDHALIDEAIQRSGLPSLSWGSSSTAGIQVRQQNGKFTVSFKGTSFPLALPFSDKASVENCFHCVTTLFHLGYSADEIQERIQSLQSVPMRLELKEGINQSQVIDDTYNNDLAGLQISLEFLTNQHQKNKKRVILSDILESGLSNEALAKQIGALISKNNIHAFIGIGKVLSAHQQYFPEGSQFYSSTAEFVDRFDWDSIQQEVILVKGARAFQFEKIVERIQRKVHGTVMEIDLGAIVHNLNFFRARLKPSTKIMVMVKAFAYGSGSTEIANLLQYHKVDYLGVAYADEGIDLRRNNISLPIMVMNPSEESFGTLLQYKLEPELYSFKILQSFLSFLRGRSCAVHIKLDTGMHRLGFEENDIDKLTSILKEQPGLKVASIFSHMAGADEATHDDFSKEQVQRFLRSADKISQVLGYKPVYHILNSPGILRLPQFQMDMVRLGIGLYGVDPTTEKTEGLKPVATLKTMVSQVKSIETGETIGYGRRGKAEKPLTLATIAIGYADGFSRAFSRGAGKVMIQGQLAPVIGNVCMDMTMVDVTGIDVKEGDEVIVFGSGLPIQTVADSIHTIPYEILTNTSERVKRVFVAESI
ncbi:bifunctional UDP-N-acetylmuramoyl-tripeptide:D-alanyl-D-alanine ligase/alanine racemase [Fulvivirgaceae bacterium PWU4]|uniref:Alanine racemase n=1 Tax=Chryseosolibacter histidini TaxID=2782349 RepID=A0AAP2DLR4_9BACT|nr:bifunctional UDP-N-acetylmuramoyl-tripeptide:D-alanyl-D-alanine ligase/alanine racemase [Chryseosolibacter histidini]MBT1698591.1 bifunctional UDP-N-acetylmuramoyl-tripeptide:D-alanyl-D-alanine ligase/alanine racemase [Chryseosolibacter histidini]